MSKSRSFSCGSGSNLGVVTNVEKLTFDQFAERIANPKRDRLTENAFHALTEDSRSDVQRKAGKEQQDAIKKRAGWYVPGKFAGSQRSGETIRVRNAVTLDIDNATPDLLAAIEAGNHKLSRSAFAAHETHKSTEQNPRIRVIVWLARMVDAQAFPRIARAVARELGLDPDELDKASFEPERLMYWPSRPSDSDYWYFINDGEPLDPDALILAHEPPPPKKDSQRVSAELAIIAHNTRQFESFEALRECVMAVKNDKRFKFRADWRDFIAAIHFESDGSEDGRELAHEWSETWEHGDDAKHTDETWDSLHDDPTQRLNTGRTIIKFARDDGWRPKPRLGFIELRPADLNPNLAILDATMAAHAETLNFYRRAGMFQHIEREKQAAIFEGEKVDDVLALSVVRTSARQLQQIAMQACEFKVYDARSEKLKKTECPKAFAEHYLEMAAPSQVPVLHSLIDRPTLRPDGSILQVAGFDRATGLLYAPEIEFPRIPENPSKDDAFAALRRLRRVVRGFEFDSDLDRTVWLAAVLTALVRDSLPKAPLFAFDAPAPASGKTILASGVSVISRGFTAEPVPQTDEEEERKTLAGLLLGNSPFVFFDNCEAPIKSAVLNAIATSKSWKPRLLGTNSTPTLSTNVTVLFTGNNLEIVGDLVERTLICRLQPMTDRPSERKFDWSFEGECRDNRAQLVTDALTIMRAYLTSGDKLGLTGTRFDEWDRFVRQPLAWLGEGDVLAKIELLRQVATAEDTDGQFLAKLMDAWWEEFADKRVRLNDIKDDSNTGALLELLHSRFASGDFDGFNKLSAAKFLAKHKGRIISGKFFSQKIDRNSVATWRLERLRD
ncbi:MAG TPA: PriCT-2 domain-containing protein [Caulobacterales bacterium]|nr:PriCT-2 domain-containing protein [Caulobacterales bacterium]